jgi:hypothetical protein
MIPYIEYTKLEPLALQILNVIEKRELTMSEEINKKGDIIKILYENENRKKGCSH